MGPTISPCPFGRDAGCNRLWTSEGYTGGSRDIPDYGTGNSAPGIAQLMKEAVYAVVD
jgi:hypothetical protein